MYSNHCRKNRGFQKLLKSSCTGQCVCFWEMVVSPHAICLDYYLLFKFSRIWEVCAELPIFLVKNWSTPNTCPLYSKYSSLSSSFLSCSLFLSVSVTSAHTYTHNALAWNLERIWGEWSDLSLLLIGQINIVKCATSFFIFSSCSNR